MLNFQFQRQQKIHKNGEIHQLSLVLHGMRMLRLLITHIKMLIKETVLPPQTQRSKLPEDGSSISSRDGTDSTSNPSPSMKVVASFWG